MMASGCSSATVAINGNETCSPRTVKVVRRMCMGSLPVVWMTSFMLRELPRPRGVPPSRGFVCRVSRGVEAANNPGADGPPVTRRCEQCPTGPPLATPARWKAEPGAASPSHIQHSGEADQLS